MLNEHPIGRKGVHRFVYLYGLYITSQHTQTCHLKMNARSFYDWSNLESTKPIFQLW